MHVLIVAFALLLWASPALAEQKAPDGFGPIKFGMTKEQAWEAIGGEGHWEPDDVRSDSGIDGEYLIHKVGLPKFLKDNYEVRHHFANNRAGTVVVLTTETRLPFDLCSIDLARILGILTRKYEVQPIRTGYETVHRRPPRLEYIDIYHFQYHANSFIQIFARRILEDTYGEWEEVACKLYVQLYPPQEHVTSGF